MTAESDLQQLQVVAPPADLEPLSLVPEKEEPVAPTSEGQSIEASISPTEVADSSAVEIPDTA